MRGFVLTTTIFRDDALFKRREMPSAGRLLGANLARHRRLPPRTSLRMRWLRRPFMTQGILTLSFMDQNLCRRLMPRPEFGRSHPTTAATAPATVRLLHLQAIGREQMAMAAAAPRNALTCGLSGQAD